LSQTKAKSRAIEGSVLIKAISVIRQDGACLFHQNFGAIGSKDLNPQLMGGFFSAISHYAQVNSGQKLHSIHLDEDVILIENEQTLFFILQYSPARLDSEGAKLILLRVMEQFLAKFPGAAKSDQTDQYESFYEVVALMIADILQQTIQFQCPWCQNQHSIVIERNLIAESAQFPFKYVYVHGGNQAILNLYVGKDFKVLKVEVAGRIEMKQKDVAQILNPVTRNQESLTPEVVFGFVLSKHGQMRTQYLNPAWVPAFDFQQVADLWQTGAKYSREHNLPDQILFRLADAWLLGVRANNYELIVVVAPGVDAVGLFPQIGELLNRLVESLPE
jgi:hypothetical protein